MKNRSGSYKKILISEDQLSLHKDKILACLRDLNSANFQDFQYCTLYIILFLRLKHPKNWMQKKKTLMCNDPIPNDIHILDVIPPSFELNTWEKQKLHRVSFREFFNLFNLKGIPLATNRSMTHWSEEQWPIKCLKHIPSPRELLKMQSQGHRCITLIVNPEEITQLVLSSRDPLSFVIHDLDHADHFFSNKETHLAQVTLFKMIDAIYDKPEIKKGFQESTSFKNDFHYVSSDMNAYVIHMLKCFKSAFDRFDLGLFQQVLNWWNLTPEAREAARLLSTPHFSDMDENNLVRFFNASSIEEVAP